MSSFDGRLHLPGQSRIPLGVEVDISNERMVLTTGGRKVGDWSLDEVDVVPLSDGFHMKVDGEEIVLKVADPARFEVELGVGRRPRRDAPEPAAAPAVGGHTDGLGDSAGLRRRISEAADALASEAIAPAEALSLWLGLLKEINRLHGDGAMPTPVFYELNTRLLDLIPAPGASTRAE